MSAITEQRLADAVAALGGYRRGAPLPGPDDALVDGEGRRFLSRFQTALAVTAAGADGMSVREYLADATRIVSGWVTRIARTSTLDEHRIATDASMFLDNDDPESLTAAITLVVRGEPAEFNDPHAFHAALVAVAAAVVQSYADSLGVTHSQALHRLVP